MKSITGFVVNTSAYGVSAGQLSESTVPSVSAQILADYSDILGIGPLQLQLQGIRSGRGNWYVAYRQMYGGIPVWRSGLGFTIERNGNIHTMGGTLYPSVSLCSRTPSAGSNEASSKARTAFKARFPGTTGSLVDSMTLSVYPMIDNATVQFRLAWVVVVTSGEPNEKFRYLIDAHTGEVLLGENMVKHSDVTVTVIKQYWPQHHYDTPADDGGLQSVHVMLYNYLGQLVGNGYTNANGSYTVSGVAYTYYYANLDRDLNNLSNSWVRIQQGQVKTDYTGTFLPPSITRRWVTDETNVYHHVTVMHDYYDGSPFFYNGMDYQMLAYVNQGSGTAAWSNGTNIGFGSYAGQYWARAADVVYHEYTHCTVNHLYGEWIGGDCDEGGAMDEGFSDYFASVVTNDELGGESVAYPGSELPRDLGNNLTMDNFVECNPWYSGQIIAGACWDLRQVLSTTDQLVFGALERTPHVYGFDDYANNVVYEDDNDGNPNNGTPNLETIRSKFYAKEIYFTAGPPRAPGGLICFGYTPPGGGRGGAGHQLPRL